MSVRKKLTMGNLSRWRGCSDILSDARTPGLDSLAEMSRQQPRRQTKDEEPFMQGRAREKVLLDAERGHRAKLEDLDALAKEVEACRPRYRETMLSVSGLSATDRHLCVLVRCHFSPKLIANALGISIGLASAKRGRLLRRLFGVQGQAAEFDRRMREL